MSPETVDPPPAHVALIGLMGSGKSAVGARLAATSKRLLIDVDDRIFDQTGLTVRQLWERGGEAAYRPLERDVVVHALAGPGPDVVAVPGGAVLDPLVVEALEAADLFTVWLRAEVATLVARTRGSDHRPLLEQDPEDAFTRMVAERSAVYEALADLVIDVEGGAVDEIAATVARTAGDHPGDSRPSDSRPSNTPSRRTS